MVVKPHRVYYLGHVEAVVRKRTGNELKAGSTVPLIDRATAQTWWEKH